MITGSYKQEESKPHPTGATEKLYRFFTRLDLSYIKLSFDFGDYIQQLTV